MVTLGVLILGGCNISNLQSTGTTDSKEQLDTGTVLTSPSTTEADPCIAKPEVIENYSLPPQVDIWQRLREGFVLAKVEHPRITQKISWHSRHPKHLSAIAERSRPYLHHILSKLDEAKLPYELALIPMIESGFDPFAYSPVRASGLWQFMPYTGKHMGLEQNWWYDGRRDIAASTEAAITYLSKLYKMFDQDWLLALAAYNGGQGNVRRAIRKNKKRGKNTDFWSLKLPKETQHYIPKILALKAVLSQPEQFNIQLPAIADAPYFAIANTEGQLDLAQAAKLADIDIKTIYQLNPGFNRWATSPDGPHYLAIPSSHYDRFIAALKQLPKEQRVTWERYTIRAGDSLSTIARRFKTSIQLIQDINQIKGHSIRAGKTLLVPRASQGANFYVLSSAERIKQRQQRGKGLRIEYTVKQGDSFWSIAKKFKTTSYKVATWNNMAPKDTLRLGQKLVIWQKNEHVGPTRKVRYKVRKGDSLARIANRFGVRIGQIEHWNGINRKHVLRPGKTLTLHVNISETSS